MPAIIQSLWIGSLLSNLEKLCIQSFLDHGHEFHLYTYADVDGIPAGATVKDGNEILPEADIFYRGKAGNNPIGFSNWFRYALLHKLGGWWADMDTVCLKPFEFDEEIVLMAADNFMLNTSVMKFPKGHECMRALMNACRNHLDEQPWDSDAEKRDKKRMRMRGKGKDELPLGPALLRKAVSYYQLEKHIKPFMYFAPISEVGFLDDSFREGLQFYPATHALHVSNSRFRVNKNANYSPVSIYEQLKRKHNIAPVAGAETIAPHQVYAAYLQKKASDLRKARRRNARIRSLKFLLVVAAFVGFAIGFFVG